MNQDDWLVTDTLDLLLAGPSYEVSFFRNDIIFLSTAHQGLGRVPMDQALLSNRQLLFSQDPFPYPPAGLSFTSDLASCYVTGYKQIDAALNLETILALTVEEGMGSSLKALPFTHDSCRYLHPALSIDDSLMVFSSDRLPTSGGLDLFVVRLDSSAWSQPESLGPEINTHGHERYPFLDQDNNLWFSSTGHPGYGAYDIFVCPFNGMGWDAPQNLGKTINTPLDEIGFSIHSSAQAILFTRKSNVGGMALRITNNEMADYSISLVLMNQANPPADSDEAPPSGHELEPVPVPVPVPVPAPELESKLEVPAESPKSTDLVFRVQIRSSTKANSTPDVAIAGQKYKTFEYHYKGSYRITVGEFDKLAEANNFRLQCRSAGFNQAFVAAFRGNKRETDPAVFK